MIDLAGGFPDGEGGTFVVDSGGDFVQSQFVNRLGNGIDGCGGTVDVRAGRDVTMNRGQRLDQAQVPGTDAVSGAVSRRRAGGFPSDRGTPPR